MGTTEAEAPASVLAGRYRLERVVARGGMGTVYAAVDQTTGKRIALKRLNPELRTQARVRVLFELEFHTLARLSHPRIIEAYESGIDQDLPYYTMELLAGRDLHELAPVAPAEAASYLRDVASALALLHTRRLLHRDLSPRNVRRTEDGRCKLLDFGAMARFGVPETLAGTPPFVPPEALQGTALDQRSDLYALGALAYHLLTGKHAYPARRLDELPERWRQRPERLSKRVAGIPDELDELVMALLHLDRMRRPASAAEVIDALQRIFALPPLEDSELQRSYFLHAPVIGRAECLEDLARRMDRLETDQGSLVMIEGPAGIGRSRLLDEASLLAQTRGLLCVRVGALDHLSDRGVARALARGLHAAAPGLVQDALGQGASEVLQLLKTSGNTLRFGAEVATDLPGEARSRLQRALTDWVLAVARRVPLILLIDDVARADEFSLSLLTALALEASRHPLLLIATRRDDDPRREPAMLGAMKTLATSRALAPFQLEQVQELVGSLFGQTVSDLQLGDFLHRHSGGNPGLCMELARHLVHAGALRYGGGEWLLTRADLSTEGLPGGLADTLSSRIAAHDWNARMLVALAAVHRGSIPVHLWLRASGLDEATFFTALDRLSDNGIMVSSGAGYGFAQESMRELVRERIEPGLLARLHLGLAQALGTVEDADDDLNQLTVGWHLVHGGREREGAELLGNVAPRLLRELSAMDAAIPALERALEILERTGAPPRLTLTARGALGRAAYTYDHELDRRHGMRTLELMHEELGLRLGDRLRPVLGAILSVRIGLVFSVLRNLLRPAHRKGPDVVSSLIHYASTLMAMMGVRLTAIDPPGVAELAPYLESLRGFVGRHGARATYLAVRALALQVLGRESTLKKLVEEAIRFANRPLLGMHPLDRRELLTGLYTSLGINESCRGAGAGLQYVPALLELGSFLGEAAALRVRLIHHMQRGQWTEAEALRRALELQAIQGGATWQMQWFAVPLEASMLLRSWDLVGARRAIEQLRALARVRPSLGALLPGLEMELQYRRGDHDGARSLIPGLIATTPPCSCVGWGTLWAVAAALDCHQGDYTAALGRCDTALAALEVEDLEYVTMYGLLDATRAWALAGLGRLDEARARIEELCARRIALGDQVGLFELYTTRCHIARLSGDDTTLRDSLNRMVQVGSELRSPGMLASAERVAKSLGTVVSRSSHPPRGEHPAEPSRAAPDASVDEAITAVRTPGPAKLD